MTDWQSAETAPKDGRYILVLTGDEYAIAQWCDPGGWWIEDMCHCRFDLWQPLPALPEEATR